MNAFTIDFAKTARWVSSQPSESKEEMIWRARRDPNLTRLAASARRRPSGSSDTKSGHFEESTLKKRHRNNLAACANEASKLKAEDKPFVQVRPFGVQTSQPDSPSLVRTVVFYNLRHWRGSRVIQISPFLKGMFILLKPRFHRRCRAWVGTKLGTVPKMQIRLQIRNRL